MLEQFTDDARRCIVYAQETARLLHHGQIGSEHFLLALLRGSDDPTGQLLHAAGVTTTAVQEQAGQGRERHAASGHIPFTRHAKQVMEHALRHTHRLGQSHIARPHLLLGLLSIPDCRAVMILRDLGVDLDVLGQAAEQLAAASTPDPEPGPGDRVTRHRHAIAGRPLPPNLRPTSRKMTPAEMADSLARLARRLADDADQAATERARLVAALRRYARHEDNCDPTQSCTCGLTALLAELDPPTPD